MDPLLPSFQRELRARAHHLHPVVTIGQHGLTAAVLHEIDIALTAHELIKVRMTSDDREERGALVARIAAALECAPVQQIGKLSVLWRPRPSANAHDAERAATPVMRARGSPVKLVAAPSGVRRPAAAQKPIASTGAAKPPTERRTARNRAPAGVPRAAAPRRRRGYRP